MATKRWAARLAGAGLAVALGTAVAADAGSGGWKPVMTDAEFTTVATADAKLVQDLLTKGASDKKGKSKVKALSVTLAAAAHSQSLKGGANAAKLAGLRDQALKVAKAVADDKLDDAKKLAAELAVSGKAEGKPDAVDFSKHVELEDLMRQFKPEKPGGRELENRYRKTMNSKQAIKPDELKDTVQVAYETAVIGLITEAMAPQKDEGPKKKADWIKWSQEMTASAAEAGKLAGAAKPDDKAVKAALKKLDASCNSCHGVFRDGN